MTSLRLKIVLLTFVVAGWAAAAQAASVNIRVNASSDDGQQNTGGTCAINNANLNLGNQSWIGTRFTSVTIPKGAYIISAYVTFSANANDGSAATLTIFGEAADNASTYTTASNNLSTRSRTTASVAWSPASWSSGTTYNSPELKTLVQEIVNRSGWASGNNMSLLFQSNDTSKQRSASTYDSSTTLCALLHVDYTTSAWWKLDETSGTSAADATGNGTTGTVTGTATWTAGVINNGFSFNGSTKIQATGLMGSPPNVSVAAWANLTTADTNGAEIISLGDRFVLRMDEAGVTKATFWNGSAWVTVSIAQTFAGTGWHHFAATFDNAADAFKLYVDGVQAATLTTTASVNYSGAGSNIVIGRHGNSGTSNDFTGVLDEVRVYCYALSATEVAQLYGLIGRWNLADASGTTAADATVFARNGTLTGTAAWSSDCGGTGVFDFDGSSHVFTVANAADFQPTTTLSISAWIKGDTWGTGSSANAILRKGDTNPNNFALQISDGRVELLLDGNDASGVRGNTVLTTGQWYHVAATWDGTTAKIYVNGVLDNSPGTARAAPIGTDTRPVYLGGRPGADYFDGMIRDIRFYNRVLTATELVQGAGLMGWWKFSEGSGTSAADSSGLGNNVTLAASAGWTSDCAGNNNALLTNGTSTGIAATNAAFNPPDVGTVAFWLRSTGAPAGVARIIGLGGDWEVRQQTDGTVVTDLCGDGATTICTTTPLTEVGRWYHLAFTFDSSNDTYGIYVDGVLEKSGTNPSAMVQQAAAVLSFGTRTGATEYWSGALRDVRIYNRKLCPSEILSLYGLVGYWKLDETSGSTGADSSGSGNHGTYSGSPSLGVTAPVNYGASFPTNGTLLTAPASASLNAVGVSNADFCVAFWVKPGSATGDWRPLFHKGAGNFERGPGIWLNQANTRVHFRVSTSANNNEGTDSVAGLTTGLWSHVACVKAGNKWRCYINGVLDTELTLTASTTGNSGPVYIGDDPWYNGSNVSMDDVRYYNRALCPTDVQALFNGGNSFGGVKIIKWVEIQ